MGIYAEYLNTLKGFDALSAERKKQLQRISQLRKSDVLVIASAVEKQNSSIEGSDLVPIADQLDGLKAENLDVILETPGGLGEVTEEIVGLLRRNHKHVSFIIPGTAKSAGTIMVMAGDEILMGSLSALGPIDAQVNRNGKSFSAEAFLEGLEKIKQESQKDGYLNRAYIPILQAISPGEIEAAKNALKFGTTLAAKWLETCKFKHWVTHETSRTPVTDAERAERADKIAKELGSHAKWLSHGRSIKMQDLIAMGIKITNFEDTPELNDAIKRYHILMRMSFETNMVKIFETVDSQIYRFQNAPISGSVGAKSGPLPQRLGKQPALATICVAEHVCPKCKHVSPIQLNLGKDQPIENGHARFPKDNIYTCPSCKTQADLTALRQQIEAETKLPVIT